MAEPPEDFEREMELFRRLAEDGLREFHCGVSFKSFSPDSLQALFVPGQDALFEETMDSESFSGFFEGFDFGEAQESAGGNRLYLNCDNSFIKSLGQVREEELIHAMIQVVYVQALLAGHYTLAGREMELMNKSLQQLMEYVLKGGR